MAHGSKIYTVHVNDSAADMAERVELVREGFALWAFVFGAFWLLYHKLWVPFFIYVALLAYIHEATARLALGEFSASVLQLGLQVLLAVSAFDIRRWGLGRKGYRMRGVVIGDSELSATQRAYDRLAA